MILAVGGGAAFVGVFSVFLAAFLVLAIVTLRWAVRRDRVGRAEWVRRRTAAERGQAARPAQTNGHGPRNDLRPGQRRGKPGGPSGQPTGQPRRDARDARDPRDGLDAGGPGGAR